MSSNSSPDTQNEAESDIEFSVCSLSSELDLDFACRGTTKVPALDQDRAFSNDGTEPRTPESLLVLTAKAIALHFPFEVVESSPITVPEELQRLIAFHSFPTDEDDIWLYSCLSSGGSYEFDQGEALWGDKAVRECVQIGFHLSATVLTSLHIAPALNLHTNGRLSDLVDGTLTTGSNTDPYHVNFGGNHHLADARRTQADVSGSQLEGTDAGLFNAIHRGGLNIEPGYPAHRVSLTFDRGRITSCSCTCTFDIEERCANLASPRNVIDYDGTRNAYPNGISFPLTNPSNQNGMFSAFSYQPMSSTESNRNAQNSGAMGMEADHANHPTGTPATRSGGYLRSGNGQLRNTGFVRSTLTKQLSTYGTGMRWGVQSNPHAMHSFLRPNRDLMALNVYGGIATAPPGTWCSHVVATCLMRIRQPDSVLLRAPISESLSKLSKEDLQKFAQNLICHVGPKKILPAAQCILDQLLDSTDNPMKSSNGAPDPTAGGALGDAAAWCFDGAVLEEKLRVTLRRFWASKPSVLYSDIGSLNSHFPAGVENFHCVLQSLRGNDPRGLWDLLSIIGDMMRRQDNNGVLLLEIVTRCMLDMQELMLWWYMAQLDPCLIPKGVPLCQKQTQYAALWLCEEIVQLWRLACLNPELRPCTTGHLIGRCPSGSSATSTGSRDTFVSHGTSSWLLQQLTRRLRAFHIFALEQAGFRVTHSEVSESGFLDALIVSSRQNPTEGSNSETGDDYRRFRGFKPALAACLLIWPSELPPTHTFSSNEFRTYMPTFNGARLTPLGTESQIHQDSPMTEAFSNWMRTSKKLTDVHFDLDGILTDVQDPMAYLFSDLPTPQDEVELAFAKFQALDAHGHSEQALIWARYLACRLLYLAQDFVNQAELTAFQSVAEHSNQATKGGSLRQVQPTNCSSSTSTRTIVTDSRTGGIGSRPSRKTGNSAAFVTPCSSSSGSGVVGGNSITSDSSSQANRSKKQTSSDLAESNTDRVARANSKVSQKAVEWATKVSHLLDQIRCLMECLTRGYNVTLSNPTHVSSASRITTSGRALLTFRGPDPASLNLHLDDTASPIAQQTVRYNSAPIRDEWTCIDIELAFRLGFYGLSLPRPPTQSPTLEVRLFDQEVALLTRMCRLPLHIACPHVLSSIRQEALRLARSLSIYQTDILVPYNLAIYLFHQLVGTHRTTDVIANLTDPSGLLVVPPFAEASESRRLDGNSTSEPSGSAATVGANQSNSQGSRAEHASPCPVLATGAILAGPGLPLVVSNHLREQREREQQEREEQQQQQQQGRGKTPRRVAGAQADYLRAMDLASLEEAVIADADLGFSAVLSVIACRSRVPESTYSYFIEGQWAQLDAFVVYLLRHYRDELAKLDRILLHLLDRYYNPNFQAPPLWACLTLNPRDLMRYTLPDVDSSAGEISQNATRTTNASPELSRPATLLGPDPDLFTLAQQPAADGPPDLVCARPTHSILTLRSSTPTTDVEQQSSDHKESTAIASASIMVAPQSDTNQGFADNRDLDDRDGSALVPRTPPQAMTSAVSDTQRDLRNAAAPLETSVSYRHSMSPNTSPARAPHRATSESCIFDPTSASEDTDTLSDSKMWTEAFRCATLRNPKRFGRHSVGMAAVDTSAPETTSSDNSPAATRRMFITPRSVQSTLAVGRSSEAENIPSTDILADRMSPTITATGTLAPTPTFTSRNARGDFGLPLGRSRNRAVGTSGAVNAHAPVSSYSSTSLSEDDDHVPTRVDPPDVRDQLVFSIPTNTTVGDRQSAPELSCDSRISETSCSTNIPLDDNSDQLAAAASADEFHDVVTSKSQKTTPTNLKDGTSDPNFTADQWCSLFKRLPPQPLSDSIAFHTFHLAKLVRKLAGGPSASGSVFVAEPDANGTVHRNLHLVAFQIGLYGLGLYNALLPSWQSRTYSRDGGWISQQVFEIGIPAACILYHSWQQHLTAAELAAIAFQLSRENNRALVDIAAELCLASLSMCTTLKPHEIYRAIGQCEEHSSLTLERGLLRIESSENRTPYGILPEIHFFLARSWFSLHQSATEEYKKALETFQQQQQQQQIQKQHARHQRQDNSPDIGADAIPKTPDSPSNTPIPPTSADIATPTTFESAITGGSGQMPSTAWPGLQSPFPPVNLMQPPPMPPPLTAVEHSLSPMIYPTTPLNSTAANFGPMHPTSLPIYPSMFYYPQPSLSFNQAPVYNQYRQSLSQPALLPTPGQSNPMVYAQTAQFARIPCLQTNAPYAFHPNSTIRVPVTRMLSVSPQQQAHVPSNFTSTSGLLASNPQMLPLGPFVSPVQCATTPRTSQPMVPAMNMFFQMPRDQLTESALYAANMTNLVHSPSPASVSICTAAYSNRDAMGNVITSSTSAELPSTGGFACSMGPSVPCTVNPLQPVPTATQLSLAQRLASMSNASSSVVVHPASSDRGSSTSETDSNRPTESVTEGGLVEDSTGMGMQSTVSTFAAAEATNTGHDQATSRSSPVSATAQLKSLEAKAHLYLRRAYLCATSAIKKIFLNQSSNTGTFDNSSSSHAPSSGRGSRGHKSHHSHHHVHHNTSLLSQSRRSQDVVNSTGLVYATPTHDAQSSCYPNFGSTSLLLPSETAANCGESGRPKVNLALQPDSLVAKAWDANILWTLDVASGLGPSAVHEYCNLILQCVQRPLLMREITVKVIDYFKRLSSSSQPAGSHPTVSVDQPATVASDTLITSPSQPATVYYSGHDMSVAHFYPPPFISAWPGYPPDSWSNNTNNGHVDHLVPFPPSSYMPNTQACPMRPPWAHNFSPIRSCQSAGEQLTELIARYQQLGFQPDQAQRATRIIFDPCAVQQQSAPPPPPLQQHDSLSISSQQTVPGPTRNILPVPTWPHTTVASQPPISYQSAVNSPMAVATTTSGIDQDNEFGGRELIERFVNRTHALFHKFIEHRLQYIGQGQTEWDDFVDLILKAYNVHLGMPATDCGLHWNNLLTRIRRHQKCSAALWQRILAGIQTADLKRTG